MRSRGFRDGFILRCSVLGVVFGAILADAAGEGLPAPDSNPVPTGPRRIEVKLVLPADKVANAEATLMQPGTHTIEADIMFFDTPERGLAAAGLILRARWKSDGRGDSTVKMRGSDSARELSDEEKAVRPEEDWVNDRQPLVSRSLNNLGLSKEVIHAVIFGTAPPQTLFDAEQIRLIEARMAHFRWDRLQSLGPIHAELWSRSIRLKDFSKPLVAERWHAQKDGRVLDVLELSAKANPKSDEAARALAQKFFAAAAAAGFGSSSGASKTQLVADFFQTGE